MRWSLPIAAVAGLLPAGCAATSPPSTVARPVSESPDPTVEIHWVGDLVPWNPQPLPGRCAFRFVHPVPAEADPVVPPLREPDALIALLRPRTGIVEADPRGLLLRMHGAVHVLALAPAAAQEAIRRALGELRKGR